MVLSSSQKNSLLLAYYKTFPLAITKGIFSSTCHKQSELLAVCLSHYKGSIFPLDAGLSLNLKFCSNALFNISVTGLDVLDLDTLKKELGRLGIEAGVNYKQANFDQYVDDIRLFTSQLETEGYFSFEEFSAFLVINNTEQSDLNDDYEEASASADSMGVNSSLEDEEDYEIAECQPGHTSSELVEKRLSTIIITELIKHGSPKVQELLNNLSWVIKAKHSLDGTTQDKTPIQVDEALLISAITGCNGIIDEFAHAFGIPAFMVRFPQPLIQLRAQLMDQVFNRTAETSTGSVRGPSMDWFTLAEKEHKSKMVFDRYTQMILTKLLIKNEDKSIDFVLCSISEFHSQLEYPNNMHRLLSHSDLIFKEFINQNITTNLPTPYILAKRVKHALHKKMIGQSQAVENILAHLSALLINGGAQHLGVSTFLGASGTGKTYLAESIGEVFHHTLDLNYEVNMLNMEQYSDDKAVLKLFGSGSQYVDSALGDLTLSVVKNPRSIIVFDEIEKAHPEVIQSLLTLIDKGYAFDMTTKRKIDFSLCYFVFTTNIGSLELTGENKFVDLDPIELLTRKKSDKDRVLSLEMANRLAAGNIAVFKPFKAKDLVTIARNIANNCYSNRKIQWPVLTTAEIILTTLGGAVSPRTIATKIDKLEGHIIDYLIDELPEQQLVNMNKIRVSPNPLLEDTIANIQVVSCQNFIPTLKCENVTFISNTDFTAIENAFKRDDIAILIDETNIVAGISSLHQLIKLYPNKAVFSCSFDCDPAKLAKYSAGSLLQKHYSFPKKADAKVFNHIISLVKYQSKLINNTEIALTKNTGVTFELTHKLSDIGIEIGFTSLIKKQRVRSRDADLPFLSFAGKPEGSLDDVIGQEDVKKRLKLILNVMKDCKPAIADHIAIPKGYLFTGLPGTGKTHLARSLAAESDIFFFAVNAADLLLGNPIDNINRLFEAAKQYAPCIIFLDEIDSIAKSRQMVGHHNAVIVNALLTAMDGFKKDSRKVFVLAATNSPEELDPALKRAGRFDRTVYFNLPCKEARSICIQQWFDEKEIKLELALKDELVAMLANTTIGRICEILNNSVLTSLADDSEWVPQLLIEEVRATKLGSISQSVKQSKEQISNTAYHEAGHLVAHKLLLPDIPVDFASIQPRGAALGMVVPGQSDNEPVLSKHRVKAYLKVLLAGIAAEQMIGLIGDAQTIGGTDDRRKATNLAKRAIVDWGMSEPFGLAIPSELTISNEQVNTEINLWLSSAYKEVCDLLITNKTLLDRASAALIEKEQLNKNDIDSLFLISLGFKSSVRAA
jgi:cell division protease FtsH